MRVRGAAGYSGMTCGEEFNEQRGAPTVMSVQQPTHEQMAEIAEQLGLNLSPTQIEEYLALMVPTVAAYNALDRMADNLPRVNARGGPGGRPGCWQKITRELWPAPYLVMDTGLSIAP